MFVLKGCINNRPALLYVMAWRQTGYKLSTEPMVIHLFDTMWRQYI